MAGGLPGTSTTEGVGSAAAAAVASACGAMPALRRASSQMAAESGIRLFSACSSCAPVHTTLALHAMLPVCTMP